MKKELFRNSLSGIVQLLLTAILTFLSIPVFLNKIGSEAYGVFAMVSVVGNLNIFINLGLNSSLIKFLAEQGKTKESNYDILVTLILTIALLLPLTLLFLVFKQFILYKLIRVPDKLLPEAVDLYVYMLISNFFIFIGNIFGSILSAQQKVFIFNYAQTFYSFLYWSLVIIVLFLGYGLSQVGLMIMVAAVVWFVVIFLFSIYTWGEFPKINGLRSNFVRVAKKQISYGYKVYAIGIVVFFYEPLTKLLIANLIGIKEVGFYEIALKIKVYIVGILSKAMQPLFPLLSELKDKEKIRLLVHDITQKALFICIPIIVCIIFCTKPIIFFWIKTDQLIIANCVSSIACIYLLNAVFMPNYFYLLSKDHVGKTFLIQLLGVVVNIFIILATYKILAFYSVIIGNMIAILASLSLNIYYQNKYLKSLIVNSLNQLFLIVIIFLLLLFIGIALNMLINSDLVKLFILPIVFFVSSIYFFRIFSLITVEDIDRYLGNKIQLNKLVKTILIKN